MKARIPQIGPLLIGSAFVAALMVVVSLTGYALLATRTAWHDEETPLVELAESTDAQRGRSKDVPVERTAGEHGVFPPRSNPISNAATAPKKLPQRIQRQSLSQPDNGVIVGSIFGESDRWVSLVDYDEIEDVEDSFPPLTLPAPQDNPAFVPPTPGLPANGTNNSLVLPTRQPSGELPSPEPLIEIETSDQEAGLEPQENDSDAAQLVDVSELSEGESVPPLTLPPLTLPPPEGTGNELPDDPFRFSPDRSSSRRNFTKNAGQIVEPSVVDPTPVPPQRQSLSEVLQLPKGEPELDVATSPTVRAPLADQGESETDAIADLDFEPVERDADQALLLQAARNALRLKDAAVAIERFANYLREYPDDAEIRLEFAGVLSAHDKVSQGAQQIEHLLRQFPNNISVLRRYADLQMQLNQYDKAEPILEQLIVYPEHRIDAAIDLARVYANTGRRQAAVQIYEEILQAAAANEPGRQMEFARLLLDIRRPTEALELLWQVHRREPVDLEVVELLVLASARSGSRLNTFELIDRMKSIEPENVGSRMRFSQRLFQEGFHRESILVDQQVLDFEPGNEEALVRSAEAHLRLYEPLEAQQRLSGVARDVAKPRYLRVQALYHSLIGEHAEAIAICRRVLSQDPSDLQMRLVLGDVYMRATQLQRAIDTFHGLAAAAQEPGVMDGRRLYADATLSEARALAEAKRFDEALTLLEVGDWSPEVEDAVFDTLITILGKARRYRQGIHHLRVALADALGNPHREIRLRSWLGMFLARNGEYASAIQELSVAEQMADEPLPESIYGKYQAYRMLEDQAALQRVRAQHLGPFASDSYLRVRVAELATEDCDCCLARDSLQALDSLCDTNPMIANRLGEACLMCASCDAAPDCAGYFQRALTVSPANVQALLGISRTLTRVKQYQSAYRYYQKAERYMSDDLDLKREIARMVREWKGPEAGSEAYQQAMALTATEHLVVEAKQNPELLAELEREYQSRSEFGAVVATEMTGKQLAGWMPLSAISIFEGVAEMEPHNQDAVFEIGQAYSQLNRTFCAIEQYERLLCLNPCHREAQVALDRNRREISPQLHLFTRASSQKGRQDLSTIDHFRAGHRLQFPLGEEDEFLQLGYARATYDPPGAPQLDGHIAIGRVQWKPVWPIVMFGEMNYEVYDYGFRPRFNFDVGSRFRYIENAELRVHFRQENVAQNRVAIRRDIHRWGSEIGNYWQPSSRFEVDTLFRYWDYSDDNQAWEGGVHTGYQLTHGRDRMRWLTDFDWMMYRHEVKFADPNSLESVNFPYFAPDLFWFLSGGIELRHYFGCDTFKAGNRRWIEGYVGGRVDSDGIAYGSVRGEYWWDYHTRLTSSGYFEYLTSDTYTNGELGFKLTLRY